MTKENMLANLIKQNEETIEHLRDKKTDLIREKNETEAEKKAKILEKNKNIESMSSNFSAMLKETLDKMKQRIDTANKAWEDENERKMTGQANQISDGVSS